HSASQIIEHGRVGAFVAMHNAHKLIYQEQIAGVIVAGVDSMLMPEVINTCMEADRLMTSIHSDGFIPGEGAGALLLVAGQPAATDSLQCNGLGFGHEAASIDSGLPL